MGRVASRQGWAANSIAGAAVMNRMSARALDWRPLTNRSLHVFVTIQFGSGLIFHDITVHQVSSRRWASPPDRPMIGSDASVLRDDAGKIRHRAIIKVSAHGVRSDWSHQVLGAIAEAFSEALGDPAPDEAA